MASTAGATTMGIHGYSPAVCTRGVYTKASKVLDAQITAMKSAYDVELNLALYECKENAVIFTTYLPQPQEFIEVYQFEPYATDAIRFGIPSYAEGKDYAHVSFQLPRDPKIKERKFRFDVFLYGTQIPYELTIQDGSVSVHGAIQAL